MADHKPLSIYNWDYKKFIDEYHKFCKEMNITPADVSKKEVKEFKEAGKTKSGDWDPFQYMLNMNEKFDKTNPVAGLPDRYKSVTDFVLKSYDPKQTAEGYETFAKNYKNIMDGLSVDPSNKNLKLQKYESKADYIFNPGKYEHPFAWAKHGMLYNLLRPLGRWIKYGSMSDEKFGKHLTDKFGEYTTKAEKKKAAEEFKPLPIFNQYTGQLIGYMGAAPGASGTATPQFIAPAAGQPGVPYVPFQAPPVQLAP